MLLDPPENSGDLELLEAGGPLVLIKLVPFIISSFLKTIPLFADDTSVVDVKTLWLSSFANFAEFVAVFV